MSNKHSAKKTYFSSKDDFHDGEIQGCFRKISVAGGVGLVAGSMQAKLELGHVQLYASKGSLVFWLLPLETLATAAQRPDYADHLPNPSAYILLSDTQNREHLANGRFKLVWDSDWYPQMYFRMDRGLGHLPVGEQWTTGVALTNHFTLEEHKWYCFAAVWDRDAGYYALYANGMKIAQNNAFPDPSGALRAPGEQIDTLYAGHTCFAMGDFLCYEEALSVEVLREVFALTKNDRVIAPTHLFEKTPFQFFPDDQWQQKWSIALNQDKDLDNFYIQGNTQAPSITPEGLLIETPVIDQPMRYYEEDDLNQLYLWSREPFEGDIYVKFEFMPLQRGGLSLICLQASGMQREDFMQEYPLRTTGSMRMIHLEDVRSYHWEFYREMNDCRNDGASHGLFKNPWLCPLAFVCEEELYSLNTWHVLEFLQQGPELSGAVDGKQIFNVLDSATTNNGPILNFGRFALRCMIRSKLLYRNLEIWNRPNFSEL